MVEGKSSTYVCLTQKHTDQNDENSLKSAVLTQSSCQSGIQAGSADLISISKQLGRGSSVLVLAYNGAENELLVKVSLFDAHQQVTKVNRKVRVPQHADIVEYYQIGITETSSSRNHA